MEAVIKIKTNRIFFERFEAPCGEPEVSEIRNAWAGAIVAVIEAAGFNADVDWGVGFDPAVKKFVTISTNDECDCENPPPECDCEAKDEIPNLIKLCEKYGEEIAEKAVNAGYEAAAATSAEFVKASEDFQAEQEKINK